MAAAHRIPARLASTAVAWEGDVANRWLAARPATVAEVAGLGVRRDDAALWCLVQAVERGASAHAVGDDVLREVCADQVALVATELG